MARGGGPFISQRVDAVVFVVNVARKVFAVVVFLVDDAFLLFVFNYRLH